MRNGGHWPDRVLTEYLDEAARDFPDQMAIVDDNSMTERVTTLTYGELKALVDRMALGLVSLGIEPRDVVSFQLPNWHQFTALYLACARIGAVANPLMPIFRQRELTFMLGFAESKLMVVPRSFRGFDHGAMLEEIRGDLPALRHLLVVEGGPQGSYEQTLTEKAWEEEMDAEAVFAARKPGPDDVTELQYTSGTTGQPKGVMQTPNTLISNIVRYIDRLGLGRDDVVLMASPLAHQTGFMYGMMMPVMLGCKAVLQDIWDPARAVRNIAAEGVTFTMASTPFLSDLTDTPAVDEHDVGTLRMFLTAGAPIPRVLVHRAEERLKMRVISAWGMTENGCATLTRPDDPPEKVFGTDGLALPGLDVRIVDDSGALLPEGEEGRLQIRGMCNFAGYLKKPELFDMDSEGWFNTGDLARMDAEGYIRISGRSKDIIIRGGENIPVVEVEGLLYRHPAILDVAVVGMPDPRMGERGCAFATLRPGESFSLADLIAFLASEGMAKQYFPERLEILGEMPRTASGKIQKYRLREIAKEYGKDFGE